MRWQIMLVPYGTKKLRDREKVNSLFVCELVVAYVF